MKKLIKCLVGAASAVTLLSMVAKCEDRTYGDYLVNFKALSYDLNADLKLDKIDDLSIQAIYSSATIATVSFGTTSVTLADSSIVAPAHGMSTGFPIYLTSTNTAPSGLTNGTTYYAIVVDSNDIRLATTTARAIANSYAPITDVGVGPFTLTPVAFAGTFSFKFQGSNDNTNWFELPNASSVTYSAPGTTNWDGPIYFRWLRFKFTAGTGGGMRIQVIGNGKQKK